MSASLSPPSLIAVAVLAVPGESMPAQIQPWDGEIIQIDAHYPIRSKIMGKTFVLQCPGDVYEGGKSTPPYKTWYKQEYKRHVAYLASRVYPRAQRAVVKEREQKNHWAKRMISPGTATTATAMREGRLRGADI